MAWKWPWQKKGGWEELYKSVFAARATKSGATVNAQTALETSTALACARVIAEGLAQVPLKLFRSRPDGGSDLAKDHPVYALLYRRPNEWQTSYELREQMGLHLVLCGNFFAFKNIVRGKLLELLPFDPGSVTVTRSDSLVLSYQVRLSNGSKMDVPAANMWHVRGPSWNGWMGLEGVKLAREAIGLALATEEHAARMFSNGARVGGILSTDSTLKTEQVQELRKSWEETQGGNANAFKTAILWGGLKFQPSSQQNDHAQLIEQRKFQVEEVCRTFRVMPIMVGYSDKTATYASSEQMFLAHVVHTLGPWYERVQQSAEVNLLTEQDRAAGYYVKFIVAGLLRGAHKDRAEYFAKALGAGGSPAWMTQDEVRSLDELNPMGGDAARLPNPTNIAPSPTPTGDNNATS